MRVLLKLSVIVLLAIGCQLALGVSEDQLDEAAFTARVLVANWRGVAIDSQELIDDAAAMLDRQQQRALRRMAPATQPSTQPASYADLEW